MGKRRKKRAKKADQIAQEEKQISASGSAAMIQEQCSGTLAQFWGLDFHTVDRLWEKPPRRDMGDLALPCFQLAKGLRKAPQEIAKSSGEAITATGGTSFTCDVSGAYVRLHIDHGEDLKKALAAGRRYGFSDEGSGKTVVIDFSSPNTAKHFHLGHLRSTVIGAALGRLFRAQGYRVVGINYLGDWGTQFGKLVVAIRRWGEEDSLDAAPVGPSHAL